MALYHQVTNLFLSEPMSIKLSVDYYLMRQGTNELTIFVGHQDSKTNELNHCKYLKETDVMVIP